MNSVRNDVRGKPRIGQHFAKNSRIAVVQRPHGVKRVGGMARARGNAGASSVKPSVGVAQAHANTAPSSLCDHFKGAGQFGRDRQHPDVSPRRLPEAIKRRCRRLQQILRRMNPAPAMADERTFKMDSTRPRPLGNQGISFRCFDCIRQPPQRGERRIHRSGYRRRKIAGNPMRRQEAFYWRQRVVSWLHHVVACAAMNVDINHARHQDAVAEIRYATFLWNLPVRPRTNFYHDSIFHQEQGLLDAFQGSEQGCGGKRDHE